MTELLRSLKPRSIVRSSTSGPTSWAKRVFPGDRRVWRWSLLVLLPALVLIGYELLIPRTFLTSTDSVAPGLNVATVRSGQQLCTSGIPLAADTGKVSISYLADKRADVQVSLSADGQRLGFGSTDSRAPTPPSLMDIPLTQQIPAGAPTRTGSVCVRVAHGGPIQLYGYVQVFPGTTSTLDGRALTSTIGIYLGPPVGQRRSLIDSWSTMMRRLTIFRPGFAGVVFYWLLFCLGLPLLAYLGIRLLAQAGSLSVRRIAASLVLIAFLGGTFWAITTYSFDAPDEPQHFAYTEFLATTGKAPAAVQGTQSQVAADEALAINALRQAAEPSATGRPWFASEEHVYEHLVKTEVLPSNDGGGFAAATGAHSPLYYGLLIPAYEAGSHQIFTELFWMRLTSVLLAMLIPLCTFLTVRELVPGRNELAVAAGLLVCFEPMVSFMSGAVNNDNGVNTLAAISVYLTVRLIRRGPNWRVAAGLGLALALMPLMKGTGFALYPAVAVGLLALLLRGRSRAALLSVALVGIEVCVVFAIWALFAHHFDRGVLPLPGGTLAPSSGTPGAGASGSAAAGFGTTLRDLVSKVIYAIEVFIPTIPGVARHYASGFWPFGLLYVQRGFASFGWVTYQFTGWIYTVIEAVMTVSAIGALVWAARRIPTLRRHWVELAFLLLVILGVFFGVEYSYYSQTPILPTSANPVQGRYAFTALVPLAALAVSGTQLLKRGSATVVLTVGVGAMIALATASHLLYAWINYT